MNKKQKAFTLSEMIISVAILSVACIYLLQMFVTAKNLSNKSFEIDQSVRISKNIIELLSSGEKISSNSKNEMIANMKLEEGKYILDFDDKFSMIKDDEPTYRLNMKLDQKDGLNDVNIKIIRLKPYILKKEKNIEISDISSVKMVETRK